MHQFHFKSILATTTICPHNQHSLGMLVSRQIHKSSQHTTTFHCCSLRWQKATVWAAHFHIHGFGHSEHEKNLKLCFLLCCSHSAHHEWLESFSLQWGQVSLEKASQWCQGGLTPLVQPHLEENSLGILLSHWHTDFFYSTDLFWNVAEFVWCDICTVCPANWKTRCDLFPRRLSAVSKQEQTSVVSDWLHFKIMSQMYLGCVFYVPLISFKLTFSFSYLWSAETSQEIQVHLCLMRPPRRAKVKVKLLLTPKLIHIVKKLQVSCQVRRWGKALLVRTDELILTISFLFLQKVSWI